MMLKKVAVLIVVAVCLASVASVVIPCTVKTNGASDSRMVSRAPVEGSLALTGGDPVGGGGTPKVRLA